jgi:hypothetical protein
VTAERLLFSARMARAARAAWLVAQREARSVTVADLVAAAFDGASGDLLRSAIGISASPRWEVGSGRSGAPGAIDDAVCQVLQHALVAMHETGAGCMSTGHFVLSALRIGAWPLPAEIVSSREDVARALASSLASDPLWGLESREPARSSALAASEHPAARRWMADEAQYDARIDAAVREGRFDDARELREAKYAQKVATAMLVAHADESDGGGDARK